jgi:hypothetical protein
VLLKVDRLVLCVFACLLVLFSIGLSGQGQEDESYSVQLDGRKTWTLRWGYGDAVGLAASGLAAGQLALDQTLAVDISGEALSILSVEAHFDDQQAEGLQSLAIRLDTERLDGVLGDFFAEGASGLTAYGKKMKGLQLEYTFGDAVLTGVASKLEGISESKTFVGEKAHDEITYSAYSEDVPPKPRPYKRQIDGLYAYPLTVFYVEEFSDVRLSFDASEGLRTVLFQYGLAYLADVLAEDGSFALEEWEHQVIGDGEQTLLLREDAIDLVRDRLEEAIDLYNEENDLSGEDAKEYPFSRGTAYELGFLETVARHVRVSVDAEAHPILDAVRRRFYELGREGVVGSSVLVEVSPDGVTFEPITDPAYADYEVEVFADAGILEVHFPDGFFTDESAFRAAFDYKVTGGVFMLGLSIIPGSDHVFVNDAPLERDVDYMIDYEIGMLVLLIEVEATDVIRVDYERFSGGIFGSATDYATYFYGLTFDWPVSEHLTIEASVLQSAEDPGSVTDPESVKTMPNRHTVAGITGRISLDDFDADFLVAYSNDRFPFDDNARIPRPNEISAIAATEEYVFFGHRSGLTVMRTGEWFHYGTSQGLAGRSVRAIAVGDETLFLGTNSGLTVVALEGLSPLDRIGNWTNYYAEEEGGLPSASVTALYYAGGTLWVGTDAGLVSVAVDQIEETEGWTRYEDEVDLAAVTVLIGDGEALYVGTEDGLYRYSLVTEEWQQMLGSAGVDVRDLSLSDGTLYVASDRGLRSYRDGIGSGWLVLGEPVNAVEIYDGSVFYGTDGGLIDATAGTTVLAEVPITALDEGDGTLWIGSRASAEYELTIRAYDGQIVAYDPSETGIAGRDPFGFVDADAEEHTWEGFVERASFRHAEDGFTLSGRFENVSPSYRSIGSFGRSDSTGWDLAATWELGDDADVSFSHEYDISGLSSGVPESSMVNDVSLQWTFGPVLVLSAHQAMSNDEAGHEGPDSTYTSYRFSLRDRFFAERLDLGISWSDGYTWSYGQGEPRRDTSLSLNADGTILPSWSAQVDWQRPIRVDGGEWSGTERLTFRTGWSGTGEVADLAVDYTLGWRREVPGGIGSRDHELEFDVDVVPLDVSGWQVTPGATLGATTDESSLDVNARLAARARRGGLSIQGALRGGVSGIGQPVVRENEKVSLTASYSGIETLRPSLSYSIDRQVAVYKGERQATIGHSLSGRMTWSLGAVHHDELSFTLSSKRSSGDRQITASVENSYRLDLQAWMGGWRSEAAYPALDLRVETDVSYRLTGDQPDIDATTTGRLNAAFSPTWSGSLGVSYLGGTDTAGDLYSSLLLDLTFAIDF